MRIAFDVMEATVLAAMLRAGVPEAAARTCARVHTESSCDGIHSHGLNRVPRFVDYVRRGWVDAHASAAFVKCAGIVETWDGRMAPGIVNAQVAIDRAMEVAGTQGLGVVALRNTTHWMRGGTYGWRAVDRGCLAVCWTNTESCMPAWGARDNRVGNNPLVMAVPRRNGPLVLDMAMSQYSYGRLDTTRRRGESLPYPGGFDADGRLTADPGAIEQTRRILPTGMWKGSSLAIVLDAMAAMLSEGLATFEIDGVGRGSCGGCSQVFVAVDPRHFGGAGFAERIADGVVAYVQGSAPAEGVADVRYPGQAQLATRARQRAGGIVVDPGVWAEVQALAAQG